MKNMLLTIRLTVCAAVASWWLLMPASAISHDKSMKITGDYRLSETGCNSTSDAEPCEIYFELHGKAAQALYENMTSEPVAELCTGGFIKMDQDALRCFKTGTGEFSCDFGYNFSKRKLVMGDVTC